MYLSRGRGMGGLGASGAVCPSVQQLQGVTDPTDPCQVPTGLEAAYQSLLNQVDNMTQGIAYRDQLLQQGQPDYSGLLVGGVVILGAFLLLKAVSR